MDVWQITVAALRRWYVLLPLLAVTVLMALAAGKGVNEEYVATGNLMVVPGRTIPPVPNPYGSPADASSAVSIVLNSVESRRQVAELDLSPDYEVMAESRTTILAFSVRSDSPATAVDTGNAVFELAADELDERQAAAGIPTRAQYGVVVLQAPSLTEVVNDGQRRNMVVVGVLGAGASLALAVFFDDVVGLVRRRRRRRRERNAKQAHEGTSGGDDNGAGRSVGSEGGMANQAVGGRR